MSKEWPPKRSIVYPSNPVLKSNAEFQKDLKINRRYNRIFTFVGINILEVVVAKPILIYSLLGYVSNVAHSWWISFDVPQDFNIVDPQFSVPGLGTINQSPTIILAVQTQPAPVYYKYFEGGILVQSRMFIAKRDMGAVVVQAAGGWIEIDYSYL